MLLVAKQYHLAREFYSKLRNCAHNDKDAITKMVAYKQLAFTNSKMKKYEAAIICFKYMLSLAWSCKSSESELAAYEGLSMMNLYIGQIEKCKYYDARVNNGIYEPHDSQLYNVALSNTLLEHTWLRETL